MQLKELCVIIVSLFYIRKKKNENKNTVANLAFLD